MATANTTSSTRKQAAPKCETAASEFVQSASDYCCGMHAFFELVEREIREKNNSDFDNIEFLVKGAKAEISRFDKLVCAQEGGAA